MNLTDQQIKDILKNAKTEIRNDFDLEEEIMKDIHRLSFDSNNLETSKRNARIGLGVCMMTMFLLVISLLLNLAKLEGQASNPLDALYWSSVVVMIMIFVAFILALFSNDLSWNKKI